MSLTLDRLWHDVRYALRMMRRAPGFAAVAVLSLALGIGANTAIFSLLNALLLRMLPVRDPGQLVELLHKFPQDPRLNSADVEAYEHLRDNNRVLSGLIAFSRPFSSPVFLGDAPEPESIDSEYVDGRFFEVLGVQPAIGRLIGVEDDSTEADPVGVLSWSYWNGKFNLDPAVVGKQITFEKSPVTIVGVAPPSFFGVQLGMTPQVWLPLATSSILDGDANPGVALMGRLKPGVSIEQAQAELATLYFQTFDQTKLKTDYYLRNLKFELEPVRANSVLLRDQFAKPLLFVMAVVGLLLLIACTNVASMLLARAAARERELALRVALGAGKLRLLRQLLTESLLLSTAGALIGMFFAYYGVGTLLRIIASGRPIPGLPSLDIPVEPDARVLLFTTGVAVLTGVLFGLVPALRAMSAAPASSLRSAGKSVETRFGRFFGNSLVVSQVALSVLLLSAAGLFLHHLSNLRDGLGFQRDNLLLVGLDPAGSGYDADELARLYRELLDRLKAIPGVRSATLSGMTPLSGAGASRHVAVEGYQGKPGENRYHSFNWIAPAYFETLGTPLLAGRDFTFQDRGSARLALINRTMARFYFGDGNPIGKRFTVEGEQEPYEIVGVVGDAKYLDPRESTPNTIHLTAFQEGRIIAGNLVIRTNLAPEAVTGEVRRAMSEVLKAVQVERITTMAEQVDATIVPERLVAMLSGAFGALGSILAAIGLYGLLAFTVARRINEIGIRMALGATAADATWMILRDALKMVCGGLAIGIPVALWGKRLVARVMENLPVDGYGPIVFGAVAMIAVALLASYVPARRAARVDPMEALRHD